jgi:amino acid permease
MGAEIIGIVAEETERPRATLPVVVCQVSYRMVYYYVGAIFVLGLNVSMGDPHLREIAQGTFFSPFALMMERAGLPLKHFVHVISLIASLSVANTRLYISVISIATHH